jgi:hypothetical protein
MTPTPSETFVVELTATDLATIRASLDDRLAHVPDGASQVRARILNAIAALERQTRP